MRISMAFCLKKAAQRWRQHQIRVSKSRALLHQQQQRSSQTMAELKLSLNQSSSSISSMSTIDIPCSTSPIEDSCLISRASCPPLTPQTSRFCLMRAPNASCSDLRKESAPEETRPSKIQSIPNELKVMIAHNVEDLETLYALSYISRDFYDIVKANERSILSRNFLNDMVPELLAEAVLVTKASRLNYGPETHRDLVESFLDDAEYPPNLTPGQIEPSLLLQMAQLHDDIRALKDDFFRETLSTDPITGAKLEATQSPSATELQRIYSGFYMLEYFCNCFRQPEGVPLETAFTAREMSSLFLAGYSPYHVEELVCIRDYVYRRIDDILPSIKSALDLDPLQYVEIRPDQDLKPREPGLQEFWDPTPLWFNPKFNWGLELSDKGICFNDYLKESRLAKGISYLRRLFSATSNAERRVIFFEDLDHTKFNDNCVGFLSDALILDPWDLINEGEAQEAFYHEDPLLFEGEDKGPSAGWVLVNEGKVEVRYAQYSTEPARRFGYVMWDLARLEGLGVLEADISSWKTERDGFYGTSFHWNNQELCENHDKYCLRNPSRIDYRADAIDTDSDEEVMDDEEAEGENEEWEQEEEESRIFEIMEQGSVDEDENIPCGEAIPKPIENEAATETAVNYANSPTWSFANTEDSLKEESPEMDVNVPSMGLSLGRVESCKSSGSDSNRSDPGSTFSSSSGSEIRSFVTSVDEVLPRDETHCCQVLKMIAEVPKSDRHIASAGCFEAEALADWKQCVLGDFDDHLTNTVHTSLRQTLHDGTFFCHSKESLPSDLEGSDLSNASSFGASSMEVSDDCPSPTKPFCNLLRTGPACLIGKLHDLIHDDQSDESLVHDDEAIPTTPASKREIVATHLKKDWKRLSHKVAKALPSRMKLVADFEKKAKKELEDQDRKFGEEAKKQTDTGAKTSENEFTKERKIRRPPAQPNAKASQAGHEPLQAPESEPLRRLESQKQGRPHNFEKPKSSNKKMRKAGSVIKKAGDLVLAGLAASSPYGAMAFVA